MARTIEIEGHAYLRREPLGVLGLTLITLGIYGFYWYYKVNDELRRYERDDAISPVRSLMAVLFGWIIIVPPFIALYNTGKHVAGVEQRRGIQPQLEPALVIVLHLLIAIANGVYIQEHLNRIWDRSTPTPALVAQMSALPPPPPPG